MSLGRFFLAFSACLFLTNCQLINTALRLAPYLLMFADENGQQQGVDGKGARQRGLEVEQRGRFAPQQPKWAPSGDSQMASVSGESR